MSLVRISSASELALEVFISFKDVTDQIGDTCTFNVHPSKHETLTQCWINLGPSSSTQGQH